jgi:hypothetical protein
MKYNLRNLLWHLKHKGLKDEPERIAECQANLYDAVADNISYFTDWRSNHLISNPDLYYTIPISHFNSFYGLTLDKFIEIQERFNNAATGLFGLKYDNSAHILITDIYGHSFSTLCSFHNNTYELHVYDMSGQKYLCHIITKDPQLTPDQIKQLEHCHDTLMELYEQSKASHNRYQQILKYKDYIRTENRKSGYAHYTCDVYVRKDIPIDITEHEIAKYVDGWNYCFGGHISATGETETEHKYHVKVYTD